MSPHETFFLLPTANVESQLVNNNENIEFSVVDFPGNYILKGEAYHHIQRCGALIYVIDAHYADYESACQKLFEVIKQTRTIKADIVYEVFIHKVDSDMFMNDDQKIECLNAIQTNMRGLLQEYGKPICLAFQLTSIYDHTIYVALSKVVQKLLPQVSFMQQMMDTLISKSKIQKAFLFDVISKIYIATDSTPVNMQHYEICSELIDVLIDVTCIYGYDEGNGSKFDKKSSSIIRLAHANNNENIVLYLREVDKCLALVCLINQSEIHRQHLINYNIDRFKEGLKNIFSLSADMRNGIEQARTEQTRP